MNANFLNASKNLKSKFNSNDKNSSLSGISITAIKLRLKVVLENISSFFLNSSASCLRLTTRRLLRFLIKSILLITYI